MSETDNNASKSNYRTNGHLISTKRGYLHKWQDREVGFSWIPQSNLNKHWTLRFVVLDEKGKLSYYRSHLDYSPRYVLDLKGCAVQDDGSKNKVYHIFTIYHKPTKKHKSIQTTDDNVEEDSADDDVEKITPLLRFSTESLAEKNQWMDLISEACAYRSSIAENNSVSDSIVELSPQPALPPPKAKPGTLPPIYYSQPASSKKNKHRSISMKKSSSKSNLTFLSAYPPSRPMHKSNEPSYLSHDSQVRQSYRGFLNLALILLVISNFRLMIDTVRRHGSIFSKIPIYLSYLHEMEETTLEHFPILVGFILVHVFILYTFLIEYFLSKQSKIFIINESFGRILHVINCSLCLIVPAALVWSYQPHPLLGSVLLLQVVITWMKLISYAHANMDYRTSVLDSNAATLPLIKDLEEEDVAIIYPHNVTLGNIYYFWLAPTLTYQIAFPRTMRVRIPFIIGILLRMVFATAIILYLVAQVTIPALDLVVQDYSNNNITPFLATEHLLRLTIANTYIWLLVFYSFFHLFLNLLAEILRFGDRVFYKDWWNASEVASFWRLWNMPVHYWLVRHLYFPCIRLKMPKQLAGIIVFLVSAIFHEVLISIPFHKIHCWSFLGMMAQVPLSNLTLYLDRKYPGTSIGNVIFWISFCIVGQPMAAALYSIDYWERNTSFECVLEDEVVVNKVSVLAKGLDFFGRVLGKKV